MGIGVSINIDYMSKGKSMAENFDRTVEFENEIATKMVEIEDLCLKYKIPFFAAFGIKQNEKEELSKKAYCLVPTIFNDVEITDKTFGRLVAVMNGAQTIPACEFKNISEVQEYDFDTFDDNMTSFPQNLG